MANNRLHLHGVFAAVHNESIALDHDKTRNHGGEDGKNEGDWIPEQAVPSVDGGHGVSTSSKSAGEEVVFVRPDQEESHDTKAHRRDDQHGDGPAEERLQAHDREGLAEGVKPNSICSFAVVLGCRGIGHGTDSLDSALHHVPHAPDRGMACVVLIGVISSSGAVEGDIHAPHSIDFGEDGVVCVALDETESKAVRRDNGSKRGRDAGVRAGDLFVAAAKQQSPAIGAGAFEIHKCARKR